MIYQGDSTTFICNLYSAGTVTTAPLITIFRAVDQVAVVTSAAMTLVGGAQGLYLYRWTIPGNALQDDYIAIVSYVAANASATNQLLDRVRVGDTRVVGVVAQDTTVAKDSTVAKDATVAHLTDVQAINPTNNATIQSILAKVTNLPADPASNTQIQQLLPLIGDVRDFALGSWVIDKTRTPNLLSMFRVDGQVLGTFQLSENANTANRVSLLANTLYQVSGSGGGGGGYVPLNIEETPAQVSSTLFSITTAPHALILTLNGLVLSPATAYTLNGTVITLTTPIGSGDVLYAYLF